LSFLFLSKKLRKAKGAVGILLVLIVVALFGNFLAADSATATIPPIVPYAPATQDRQNDDFKSPFDAQSIPSIYYRHWLGTDQLGRDTLAGLMAGTQTALLVGLGGMSIALLIGLLLGLSAGYYGNDRFRLTKMGLILRGVLLFLCGFYLLVFFQQQMPFYAYLLLILSAYILIRFFDFFLEKTPFFNKKSTFPLDSVLMRVVEIMQAVPTILWLFGMVSINGNITVLSLIIFMGLVSWTSLARMVRGEVMRIRQLEYMEAASAMGLSDGRIIVRHVLPNVLTPVLVALVFGIANLILMEAFLTFIGFGLPLEQVTWGSMLATTRANPSAWWLVMCPGFMIFLTVYALNQVGEALRN
jgi:peptide/nickel transport system permease protein